MSRSHPLRRFEASPSLACGGRGTAPEVWQSQSLGAPGFEHFAPDNFLHIA
jgi:hypothetical protein